MYQEIQKAANKGVWLKDLRFQSNLTAPKLQKALKALEERQLVKTVKGAGSAVRKIYMLFELAPSDELTGGTWCVHARACCCTADTMYRNMGRMQTEIYSVSEGFVLAISIRGVGDSARVRVRYTARSVSVCT